MGPAPNPTICIGHGMGAHICGMAGMTKKTRKEDINENRPSPFNTPPYPSFMPRTDDDVGTRSDPRTIINRINQYSTNAYDNPSVESFMFHPFQSMGRKDEHVSITKLSKNSATLFRFTSVCGIV